MHVTFAYPNNMIIMDLYFYSQAGNRIRIMDSTAFGQLSNNELGNRLWTSESLDAGTYYIIDQDGPEFKENKPVPSTPSISSYTPEKPNEDWIEAGYIAVYDKNAETLVKGRYILYIMYIGDSERYQIREANGKSYFVMKNIPYYPSERNAPYSVLGWEYMFDGDKYFNVR